MGYRELLKKVSAHVIQFYMNNTDDRVFYHTLAHIIETLDAVNKINAHYQLDDKNYFIVCAAAWFHDTGILAAGPDAHESKSVELAEVFLKSEGVSDEDIAGVKKCILATRMPQTPYTLTEKIICDADLFNLGTDQFKEKNKLVQKETEAFTNSKISGDEWRAKTIALLESHNYHTEYCQALLNKTKENNLREIKRQ